MFYPSVNPYIYLLVLIYVPIVSVATPLTTPAARYWFFGSDFAMALGSDSGATYKYKFGP